MLFIKQLSYKKIKNNNSWNPSIFESTAFMLLLLRFSAAGTY